MLIIVNGPKLFFSFEELDRGSNFDVLVLADLAIMIFIGRRNGRVVKRLDYWPHTPSVRDRVPSGTN